MPEWTAEARDVQELVTVLTVRYEKALAKAEDIKEKQKDTTIIMVPSTVRHFNFKFTDNLLTQLSRSQFCWY